MSAQTHEGDTAASGDWVRPRPGTAGYRNDALLALAVFGGTCLTTLLYATAGYWAEPAPGWAWLPCIVAVSAPLAWRRRYPEVIAVVVAVAVIVMVTARVPELLMYNIALFIAIYSVGAWAPNRRRALVVRILIVVAMFVWLGLVLVGQIADPPEFGELEGAALESVLLALSLISIVTNLLFFAGAWWFGERAWHAARERAVLEERTSELGRERELRAEQAIALERVRIARELHDVVAHHVAVMGIQAGAARRVLGSDPATAADALEAVEGSARTAVDELHGLLTTLRSDETASETAPATVGLAQLRSLVADVVGAGTRVAHSVVGEARPLPALVDSTAYRVAQEALTNAVKHARGAPVDVRVRYLDGAVEVEVTDAGGVPSAPSATGLGLVGMRERVLAVGGELTTGPRPRGGFRVRATLPTTRPAAPDGSIAEASDRDEATTPADGARA